VAVEVRTSDFHATRTIHAASTDGKRLDVNATYYGADGALFAVLGDGLDAPYTHFAIVRVLEPGEAAVAPVYTTDGTFVELSEDHRVAFFFAYKEKPDFPGESTSTIEVVDLERAALRGVLTSDLVDLMAGFIPSGDGSELVCFQDPSRVQFLDTRSGRVVRELETGWPKDSDVGLENLCSGGRTLLVSAIGCGTVALPSGTRWISANGVSRGPAHVAQAVDTGSVRYGIDESGRSLLVLGEGSRVLRRMPIARPDASEETVDLLPTRMLVSPDGRRIIVLLSMIEEACGC